MKLAQIVVLIGVLALVGCGKIFNNPEVDVPALCAIGTSVGGVPECSNTCIKAGELAAEVEKCKAAIEADK